MHTPVLQYAGGHALQRKSSSARVKHPMSSCSPSLTWDSTQLKCQKYCTAPVHIVTSPVWGCRQGGYAKVGGGGQGPGGRRGGLLQPRLAAAAGHLVVRADLAMIHERCLANRHPIINKCQREGVRFGIKGVDHPQIFCSLAG